ncbi:preprotein translocase subunit TatA [Marinomonas ushuaiensis DSM 15871]|uniref:Sec-independent protein translocase protein TatB n=1 Tax=Marinomonas ushuaiensis DSM 15871 TaxID=1122207 RepID=X7E9L5_9GAMM|nr:Sec-independent protein translocase protein TatB [Marinomonas ushuaiensis]ETX12535.1 preprotein translocase subunit TatA [Marinomonas ushuaiensis DSM 15871]
MFDIGFSELLVVFVVGLLILGPERLPHAAKTAGLWVRKIRRSINSVQREINAQLDQEELQQKITETNQHLLKEEKTIQNTITPLPESYAQEPMKPIAENTVNNEEAPLAVSDKQEADLAPLPDTEEKAPETTTSRS